MTEPGGVRVRGLYKIFGRDPAPLVEAVRAGMGKAELLETHGHVLALNAIDLDIPPGGIFVVMGLSGSGKSTLIRHFNRIIEPTAGAIEIGGRDILAFGKSELRALRRREVSMVFQRFALLPHRTVLDNVAFGLRAQGLARQEAHARAGRWIARVGLAGYEEGYPDQLSGGMQQRVGLARALATDAGILLMDEPFSALDPLIRADMQRMLLDLQAELGKTIIFITHDLDEALMLGGRIAILRDGEVVQQDDARKIVLEPAGAHVRDFVRTINRGRVIRIESIMSPPDGDAGLRLPAGTVLEEALDAMTRKNAASAAVIDDAGAVIGGVSLRDVARAVAAPAANREKS